MNNLLKKQKQDTYKLWLILVLFIGYIIPMKAENPEWLVIPLTHLSYPVNHSKEYVYTGSNIRGYKVSKETAKVIDSISHDCIFGYFHDKYNNTWIANGAGLLKIVGLDTTWYTSSNSPLPASINNLKYDSDNNVVWIATFNGLVKKVDDEWTIYNKSNSKIQSNEILTINLDNNSNPLMGTRFNGIILYDGEKFINHRFDSLSEYKEVTRFVNYDDIGNIWFVLRKNLVKFDGKKAQIYYQSDSTFNVGNINDLYVENSENIWIADNNLYHFDGVTFEKFAFFDNPNLDFKVYSMLKDDKENYWFVADNPFDKNQSGIIIHKKGGVILSAELENNLKQIGYLFPNPSDDYIQLKAEIEFGTNFTIINTNGIEVGSGIYTDHIDISKLNPGFYTININNQNYKFIKK